MPLSWLRSLACVSTLMVAAAAASSGAKVEPPSAAIAFLAVDLASGRTLASERSDRLEAATAPGSVMKVAMLAAALESGAITERSTVLCSRELNVAGHHMVCTHPDLHRPLSPVEALAHSCNGYFATIAPRVPRASFDGVLASLGLPPGDASVPLPAQALGLEGIRVRPRQLIEMIARIAAEPTKLPWRAETLAIVRRALRAAADYGTAAAFRAHGLEAFAKTGTTLVNGVGQGLVAGVVIQGSTRIGFVLLASGGAGIDAADLAAERIAELMPPAQAGKPALAVPQAAPAGGRMLRVGRTGTDGRVTVASLSLEDYVAGVVAGEAAPNSAPAALEALAITTRTFALANPGRHSREGFDLCDLTHCQVLRPPTTGSRRAAASTRDLVLLDAGKPASVFFTASCGGHSERPSSVWPSAADPPFLPARPDSACGHASQWRADLDAEVVLRALRSGRFRGDMLRDITVLSRTASGRVEWLGLSGMTPPEISGEDFRTLIGRAAGWQHVKSTLFEVRRTGRGFHFEGRGAGHGVGLCVLGSTTLADEGASAASILERYFPGLTIGAAPAPSSRSAASAAPVLKSLDAVKIDVMLPAEDRGETGPVEALARRTLTAVAAMLDVPAPPRLRLVFHPTVEGYERATGQRWFTAASTSGSTIHLQPLRALRKRGVLESTLTHEIVHVLTAAPLEGRSAWIGEGLAAHAAGEATSPVPAGPCPADRELLRPASGAALADARARAARCVTDRLAGWHRWRDIH